jgi:hypothetical protein
MKRMEMIRWALGLTDGLAARLAEDMRSAPMTGPTPGAAGGGNHPVWVLGHLCVIEGNIPRVVLGEKNPVERWEPLFAPGSAPSADPGVYPSFDELLRTFRTLRAGTLKLLERVGDAGLDRAPKAVPPGFEKEMQTLGQTLMLISLHTMLHCGQLTDARRVAGFKPLM